MTAEVSPTEDAGITRVCLPFIQPNPHFDVDEAISSICGVVWVVGRRMGLVEEKEMQIARATHKMKIREESGELWFNKSCKSNRVATTITRNGNSFVYMYLGGGAVGEEQSEIISGIVVICKSWRWSFLVCAACRLVAMTKHNFLGGLEKLLMASEEGESGQRLKDDFVHKYGEFWDTMLQMLNINIHPDQQLQAQSVSAALQQVKLQEAALQQANEEEVQAQEVTNATA